jgi:hypothetical protein
VSACDWIICERTGRWAATLRIGAARRSPKTGSAPRIYEVRSLDELADSLAARPLSLTFLEVHTSNVGNLLQWLASNSPRFPRARFVALLDRMITERTDSGGKQSSVESRDVVAALLEGGAAEIAVSPRRLQHIFAFADKHAESVRQLRQPLAKSQSITDWARSKLPWQNDCDRE